MPCDVSQERQACVTYLLLDDGMDAHHKIEGLSDRAFRLHLSGLLHCAKNLTDGLVSDASLRGMKGRFRATNRHVDEFIEAGLWVKYEGHGHLIHNYLTWNPSRVEVEERHEKRAAAGRKGGSVSGASRRQTNLAHLFRSEANA